MKILLRRTSIAREGTRFRRFKANGRRAATLFNLAFALSLSFAASAADHPLRITPNTTPGWSRSYSYDGAGNIIGIDNDIYLYDGAGRLVYGTTAGVEQTYSYDAFGNRLPASATSPSTPCVSGMATPNCHQPYTINSTNNRISGASYDVAGNMLANEGQTYTYDALNMMSTDGSGAGRRQYLYNASNERIAVYQNGVWDWSIRDEGGKVLSDFRSVDSGTSLGTAQMTRVRDYVYRDSLLLASAPPAQLPDRHYHLDHLGSPRVITNANGQRVGEHSYLPFGMELKTPTTLVEGPEDDRKFTGHERDIRSDGFALDYMHARFYAPNLGRFLSVDPKIGSARPLVPQSWNRYSYAQNSPLRYVDPDGKDVTVAPAMQRTVDHARRTSVSFAETYNRLAADSRVNWHIDLSIAARRGTRAHATMTIDQDPTRDLAVTHIENETLIPTGGSDYQAQLLGHEAAHIIEVLEWNRTLMQRYAAGERGTVYPNKQAGPGTWESTFASEFELVVKGELSQRATVIEMKSTQYDPAILAPAARQ